MYGGRGRGFGRGAYGGGYMIRPFRGVMRGFRGGGRFPRNDRGGGRGFYGRPFYARSLPDSQQQNSTTIILPDGDPVPVRAGGGANYYRGNQAPFRGRGPRAPRGRYRSRSENLASPDRFYRGGPNRPLTRVIARARTRSHSESQTQDQQGEKTQHHPLAYRMEVNEYVPRQKASTGAEGEQQSPPEREIIHCVTVRDMHTFIPDNKQRRIWIPVTMCEDVMRELGKCREVVDEKPTNSFDLTKLEPVVIECKATKKVVEVEKVEESVRLRTYMDAPPKSEYQVGDLIETIELRKELMGRLLKFLADAATRYKKVDPRMNIPSLYSYSGERRFYFDLRNTKWGLRLHISQVTDLHRNVIGIPLESLVEFKDRLSQVIEHLELDTDERSPRKRSTRRISARGGSRKPRKNRRQRPMSGKKANEKGDGHSAPTGSGDDVPSEDTESKAVINGAADTHAVKEETA